MSEKKRISVFYGGIEYAVSGRSIDDVMAEIVAGTTADTPTWMSVSTGQGRSTSARILLGTGMPVAVWAVNADGPATPVESDPVDPVPSSRCLSTRSARNRRPQHVQQTRRQQAEHEA